MIITGTKTLETVIVNVDKQFKTQLLKFIDKLEKRNNICVILHN